MTAILVGVAFVAMGLWGLIYWFQDFVVFIRGMVPLALFLGGLMAVIAGIATLQARRGNKSKKN